MVTVSRITWLVEKGVGIKIKEKDLAFCRGLESQRKYKKAIFGSGFLTSHAVAAEIKAAEIKAAEIKAAVDVIEWELSDSEMKIIETLT